MAVVAQHDGSAAKRRSFLYRNAAWLRSEHHALRAAYLAGDLAALTRLLTDHLGLPAIDPETAQPTLAVTHLPLRDWEIHAADAAAAAAVRGGRRPPRDAALAIRFAHGGHERTFLDGASSLLGACEPASGDLRIGSALHWAPGRGEGGAFGSIATAHRLIGAAALAQAGLDGAGVHVVVVDQGVDAARLPAGAVLGGGWARRGGAPPGAAAKDNRHGTMVAHNVLALAPRATIWDCPLIPPRITGNLQPFLSDALGAVERMREDIALLKAHDPATYGGAWLFVNAWSIYDRGGEAPEGGCACDPTHAALSAAAAAAEVADIVFAAGNCGQFAPDGRCTAEVIGPGRSILGAGSLAGVLTVGAVRADGLWAGYSSQGPGQFPVDGAPQEKPDLAAPSSFRMPGTAHRMAGGTSAAAAVAAGVVAALRTAGRGTTMPPADLFDLLRRTARQAGRGGWNPRTGHGVIDCAAAVGALRW